VTKRRHRTPLPPPPWSRQILLSQLKQMHFAEVSATSGGWV
jgi:hypothetical protein